MPESYAPLKMNADDIISEIQKLPAEQEGREWALELGTSEGKQVRYSETVFPIWGILENITALHQGGEILLEIVIRRYENRSTFMTSNRPIEEWGKLLCDVPAASAILDRLLHHAEIIPITGRSYRLQQSTQERSSADEPPPPTDRNEEKNAASRPETNTTQGTTVPRTPPLRGTASACG